MKVLVQFGKDILYVYFALSMQMLSGFMHMSLPENNLLHLYNFDNKLPMSIIHLIIKKDNKQIY